MSNRLLSCVRAMDELKGPLRAVLNVLADRADETGAAWPSWRTLQRESGFGRSAVHAALRELNQRGFVSWSNRRDESGDLTSNLYRLTLPSPSDGRGSPQGGLGSSSDGLGVVHHVDGGSPPRGRRSINEASDGSTNEASLFVEEVSPMAETIPSKKEAIQKLAESIYQEYPRKVAKKDAIKAILKAMTENNPDFLLERTKAYASAIGWKETQYIPHPATWFNKGQFDDDPATWKQPSATGSKPTATVNVGGRTSSIEPINYNED